MLGFKESHASLMNAEIDVCLFFKTYFLEGMVVYVLCLVENGL